VNISSMSVFGGRGQYRSYLEYGFVELGGHEVTPETLEDVLVCDPLLTQLLLQLLDLVRVQVARLDTERSSVQ
jgi:hypothetical protein